MAGHPHFEIYPSGTEWRWRFRAANGEPLASGEGYRALADCEHAVALLKRDAPTASVQYLDAGASTNALQRPGLLGGSRNGLLR